MKKQLSSRLVIEKTSTTSKYAVITNEQLVFLEILMNHLPSKDEIYLGRVEKYNETMTAAFVNIGENSVFVPSKEKLSVGEDVLVQIVKPRDKSKLAKGTLDITIGREHAVAILNERGIRPSNKCRNNPQTIELLHVLNKIYDAPFGILLRSQSTIDKLIEVRQEIDEFKEILDKFTGKVGLQYRPFDEIAYIKGIIESYAITEIICNNSKTVKIIRQKKLHTDIALTLDETYLFNRSGINLEGLLNPKFEFKQFKLTVNFLEALCVIDIDSNFASKTSLRDIQIRKVNEQAFKEIINIIDIYKIAGIVLIDFISMDKANTEELSNFIQAAINQRQTKHSIKLHSLTNTGLAQLIIEKKHNSIAASISQSCPYCEGSGLILNNEILLDQFEIELQAKLRELRHDYEVQIPNYFGKEYQKKILEIASQYNIALSLKICDVTQIKII